MTSSNIDPAEALRMVRDTRAHMAERDVCPWWYAPAYGLGCGAMVTSLGLPQPIPMIGPLVCFMAILILYKYWQNRTGLRLNGYRRGRTRRVTFALLVVLLPLIFLSTFLGQERHIAWAAPLLGLIAAIASGFASHIWGRTWIAEMKNGS